LPSALCASVVTTDESTPPERALMAIPSPTISRISRTCSSMNFFGFRFFVLISLYFMNASFEADCQPPDSDPGHSVMSL